MTYQQFNENYELRQLLGHGTQSTVRKVIRRNTSQVFAAKIYQDCMLKAKNQIEVLIKLDHPSIVNVYEVYEDEGCIILILDYMAGGQLYDQICQRKRMTQKEVRYYIKILVDAVRYCHQLGVIHRDIKPQNLLLSTNGPDGILKLSDFGISKILSGETINTICGTPIYMAPEIWMMKQYDQKVDIWSIGVVTYYLLSGYYPFSGENTQQLLKSICHEQLTFKDQIWDSVSVRAQILLKGMLQKDPVHRITAEQILNHIWFVQSVPKVILAQQETNLSEAILNIRMDKMKKKIIKKDKQFREILKPSQKMPKVRIKFLLTRAQSSMQLSN